MRISCSSGELQALFVSATVSHAANLACRIFIQGHAYVMCLLGVINSRRKMQGEIASTQVYPMNSIDGATRSKQGSNILPSFLKSNVGSVRSWT